MSEHDFELPSEEQRAEERIDDPDEAGHLSTTDDDDNATRRGDGNPGVTRHE